MTSMLDSMLDMEITLNDEFLVQFEKLQSWIIRVVDRIKGGCTVPASLPLCSQMPISAPVASEAEAEPILRNYL